MSDLEFFPDHLQTIKEDPKDHEESKYQSPSRAQSKWLLKNSSPTTLNPDKQSSFPPGYIKETEENQSPEGRQERDSPAGKPRGNTELERMLQIEREKLTAIFQQEMQQKLEELDTKLNGYWEKKYNEIQQSYESKIHQYEELLTASQNDSQADVVANLEKEISEKYQQQYLEKIEEIQQNFKDIEEENLVQIIEEIKKDMENQYEQRFSEQVSRMRQEATDEIERHKAELNSRRGTTHEPDEFQKMLQVDVKSSIENALREKYEQEKQAIVKKYTQEQDALKKEIHTMETKMREKLEVEVEEELKKEFVRKEKLMDLNWRKKMESYKKNLEQNFEQEMKTKLENEKKEIEKAKVEISRMKSLENVRLKKAEENKKSIESKLKEQEDKYEKVINNLKKQIEELKNSSLADEERLSHVGKRENSKDARSNSLARSGHQQAKSLMDSKIMTELHNKNKQDSFLEEGFYKPDTSNAHSPLYEHTRNKSPMSPPRREVFEDRSADKFFPPKPAYNQPISNMRSRADRQSMDEPYRVVQDIIDPMAPPDLLSLEKSDHMENFSRERELPKEENKLSVITQQQASTYDILKAQIMKKYSPQKSGEFTGYDAPGETQRFDSSATSARGALVENQEEAQVERESVPLNYSMYQRERDTEKSEEDNFQKKYEAILRKYNKENFGKEKYQNSTSERGSFRKEVPTKDSNQTGQKKYQSLFEVKSDDDQKTKDMKKLKKTITDMLEKDQALESKYLGREIYFTTDFLTKIDIETTGQQKTLKNSLKILYDLWNDIETSYQARLNFLDSLELIPEYENLMKKINLEIDYLKVTQRNVGDIMGLLKKRNYYREQINFDNFDYKKFKKLYFAIDSNNMDLRKLIEPYKRKYNKDVLYKGIEANDIIKLDAWENEYLQKVELKQEILEKIRKKI